MNAPEQPCRATRTQPSSRARDTNDPTKRGLLHEVSSSSSIVAFLILGLTYVL